MYAVFSSTFLRMSVPVKLRTHHFTLSAIAFNGCIAARLGLCFLNFALFCGCFISSSARASSGGCRLSAAPYAILHIFHSSMRLTRWGLCSSDVVLRQTRHLPNVFSGVSRRWRNLRRIQLLIPVPIDRVEARGCSTGPSNSRTVANNLRVCRLRGVC